MPCYQLVVRCSLQPCATVCANQGPAHPQSHPDLPAATPRNSLHTDQLSQAVLLEFAESGRLEAHRARVLKAGAERLTATLEACQVRAASPQEAVGACPLPSNFPALGVCFERTLSLGPPVL